MRKKIKEAYESAEVIITYGYGFEFRKNSRRKGKFFFHSSEPLIFDEEWAEIRELLFKDGKGIKSQIENKNFCVIYCPDFNNCGKDTESCKEKTRIREILRAQE